MIRPRLLLAEDHTLMAEGLRGILAKDYEVVAVVADGAAVAAAVARYQPDVLLLDLSLPNRPGMELLGELVPRYPKLRILVVTMHVNRVLMEMAMRLGASGFVPKNVTGDELRMAIAEVVAGRKYVSPKVPTREQRGGVVDTVGFSRLTERQQEVMRLIARGLTSEQMAEAMGVTRWTVSFHRKNIRREIGLRSDQEMYRYAMLVALNDKGPSGESAIL